MEQALAYVTYLVWALKICCIIWYSESPIFEIEKKRKSFGVVQRDKDWYEGGGEGHKTRQDEMKKKNYGLS